MLWLLDWLDFEVAQGGLLAYFTNSHGRHASLAAAALRDIGATTMAAVLDRAGFTVNSPAAAAPQRSSPPLAEDAVVKSYDLPPHAKALIKITDQYELAADNDAWGEKLDMFLKTSVMEQVGP